MELQNTGNALWQRHLRAATALGTLGHALILSGSGDLSDAAHFAAAAYLCTASDGHPCLRCNSCRKVLGNIHPDVITVQDAERRELSVDTVRELRRDVYICPNEGQRKVYIFADCNQLNERDQNVLLKIVEEGPPYAAFIFCTETSHALLPTIRSRCTEWNVGALDIVSPEEDSQAQELAKALASGNVLMLAVCITGWENKRPKRQQLQESLRSCWDMAAAALLCVCTGQRLDGTGAQLLADRLDRHQLQKLLNILAQYDRDCEYNAGVGQVLGAMLSDFEEVIKP